MNKDSNLTNVCDKNFNQPYEIFFGLVVEQLLLKKNNNKLHFESKCHKVITALCHLKLRFADVEGQVLY